MSETKREPETPSVPSRETARELLTVIVPCLNEEGNIASTVADIRRVGDTLPVEVEIFLVDDGSTDGTVEVMREICDTVPGCRMHVNEKNLGVGRTVLDAYTRIDPESWAMVQPGDNEVVFESIRGYLEKRDQYDIILGYLQNPVIRPILRRVASNAFTRTVNFLYGFPYQYLNGLKLYRVRCFQGIEMVSGGHAFNAELIAKAVLRDPSIRIGEAPFIAKGRSTGNSKAFRPGSIWRAVREVYAGYRSVAAYREQVIRGK